MKRFLKTFSLLMAALLLLLSGVDNTLDRLERSSMQNSLTWYNQRGEAVLVFSGESALSQKLIRQSRAPGALAPSVRVTAPYL